MSLHLHLGTWQSAPTLPWLGLSFPTVSWGAVELMTWVPAGCVVTSCPFWWAQFTGVRDNAQR
jgi:hypothetical protein